MYEIISGVKPFDGYTEVAVFYNILNKHPEPLRKYLKDVPDSLERIVLRGLEKDPAHRYQEGSELASDLIFSKTLNGRLSRANRVIATYSENGD